MLYVVRINDKLSDNTMIPLNARWKSYGVLLSGYVLCNAFLRNYTEMLFLYHFGLVFFRAQSLEVAVVVAMKEVKPFTEQINNKKSRDLLHLLGCWKITLLFRLLQMSILLMLNKRQEEEEKYIATLLLSLFN